ncbi:hypothetical protein JKP88DRAFT_250260 [Tribonema minus]|uniref:Tyrosinase copper-binding domain-containing protein n=1 Tax=Tribonema minus TaxID=303371 RepID=A0A835YKM2_9STRA|nr:hypothetical protein JKP88DRAFT_250260 [Tribonema minus]
MRRWFPNVQALPQYERRANERNQLLPLRPKRARGPWLVPGFGSVCAKLAKTVGGIVFNNKKEWEMFVCGPVIEQLAVAQELSGKSVFCLSAQITNLALLKKKEPVSVIWRQFHDARDAIGATLNGAELQCFGQRCQCRRELSRVRAPSVIEGPPQRRREIRDLENDPTCKTLLVRGLQRFQNLPPSSVTSFFQAAAIHGLPYVPFDNVNPIQWEQGEPGQDVALFGGYCHHGTQLFPTWHRPYLMMFEKLEDPVTWLEGKRAMVQMPNPLYAYHFQRIIKRPQLSSSDIPGQVLPPASLVTLRHPKKLDDGQYVSDNQSMDRTYKEELYQLQRDTHQMLSEPNQLYCNFSNMGLQSGKSKVQEGIMKSACLERPHNNMHNYLGAPMGAGDWYFGHMYHPPYSSFDPVFWLHHCNVDRQLALWEALNAETEFKLLKEECHREGTFANRGDAFESGPDSPLYPFRKQGTTPANDVFWTSRDVMLCYTKDRQVTSKLGYIYPEFEGHWTPDELRDKINGLYSNGHGGAFEDTFVFLDLPELNRKLLPAPFNVRLYIKDKENDKTKHYAGTMSMFENPFPAACANCPARQNDYIFQRLEISGALQNAGWTKNDVEDLTFLDLDSNGKPQNLELELTGPGAIVHRQITVTEQAMLPLDLGQWGVSTGSVGGELTLVVRQSAAEFVDGSGLFKSLMADVAVP